MEMHLLIFGALGVVCHGYVLDSSAWDSSSTDGFFSVTKPPVPPPLTTTLAPSPRDREIKNHPMDPDGDSIVGRAGFDYPVLPTIPQTSFNCSDFGLVTGYYVDVEASCQVFHVCLESGGHVSFLCPNGTMFNQKYFVCDWWYNVNCAAQSASQLLIVDNSTSTILPISSSTTDITEATEDLQSTLASRPSTSDGLGLRRKFHESPLYTQAHL